MTAPLSPGFLLPTLDRIGTGPATISSSDGAIVEAGGALPDWDYFTDLNVTWPLTIDLPGTLDDCGLTDSARLCAALTWQASATRRRGLGAMVELSDGDNVLTATVPGSELGGVLHLALKVVLAATDPNAHRLAPRRPGSVLREFHSRAYLEGTGSRFPIVPTSFATAGIADGATTALWYLRCDGDLDASDIGSIRLYLNSDHAAITTLLSQPMAEQSRALSDMIRYDTVRQLILAALARDDFDPAAGYDTGTLGDLLVNLIRRFLPHRTLTGLRADRDMDPGEFEARIQARVAMLTGASA